MFHFPFSSSSPFLSGGKAALQGKLVKSHAWSVASLSLAWMLSIFLTVIALVEENPLSVLPLRGRMEPLTSLHEAGALSEK